MKLDNFTTAKCSTCGWVKQFQPGKEYKSKEFACDCTAPKITLIDKLKAKADELGIAYATNIGEATLAKRIKEVQNG